MKNGNSEDPDQWTSSEARLSGSTLLATASLARQVLSDKWLIFFFTLGKC